MSQSVDALRSRVEELEVEIDELESALKRPPEDVKKRRIVIQRDIDAAVDEEVLEEVVSRLRRRFSALGEVELIGRTLSWTLKPNAQAGVTRMVQVTVAPRGLGTRIRYIDDLQLVFNNRAAGYTVGLGMLGFVMVAGVAGALAGPALVPLGLAAPFVTHRMAKGSYRKVEVQRQEEANAVVDELEQVIAELSSTPTTATEEDE